MGQQREATLAAAADALVPPSKSARIAQLIEGQGGGRELAIKARRRERRRRSPGARSTSGRESARDDAGRRRREGLRETLDKLKDKLGSGDRAVRSRRRQGVADRGVTADLTAKVKAGDLVNHVARQIGGKGGRPDMAGRRDRSRGLPAALASVRVWVDSAGRRFERPPTTEKEISCCCGRLSTR
jgi:alanyl-tRNA synthetase